MIKRNVVAGISELVIMPSELGRKEPPFTLFALGLLNSFFSLTFCPIVPLNITIFQIRFVRWAHITNTRYK